MTEHILGADASAPVKAQVGDRLIVDLPESGGTGYVWRLGEVPEVLQAIGDERLLASSQRPGAAGRRVFTFTIGHPGVGVLAVELVRPWEGQAQQRYAWPIEATSPGC